MMGMEHYNDVQEFPCSAIRFREETPETLILREKEKEDWNMMSIDEIKVRKYFTEPLQTEEMVSLGVYLYTHQYRNACQVSVLSSIQGYNRLLGHVFLEHSSIDDLMSTSCWIHTIKIDNSGFYDFEACHEMAESSWQHFNVQGCRLWHFSPIGTFPKQTSKLFFPV